MRVLVIIVTYNGMRWVERCQGSLKASEVPVDVYVADNGSTDGTTEWIREHYPEVRLVINTDNLGFGAANNMGMRYALENDYDYVYLLNQDAWIMPDTIGKLLAVNESHPEYVLLSPMQMNDGLEEMNRLFKSRVVPSRRVVDDRLWSVPFVMAAHWFISRKGLEEVGLFSPLFHFNGEDDNYCSRVLYHGYGIGVVPDALVVHDIGDRKQPKERYIYRSVFAYALHRFSDPGRKPFCQALYIFLYSLYSCLKFKSFLPLKYMREAFGEYRKAKEYRKKSMSKGAFI